jgi:phosphohistidine phosphatase
LRLLLLRHAKSDWTASAKVDDHERPLNGRGRRTAPEMGEYLRLKNYMPALVLCSTATRAKETLELILPALKSTPKVRYDRKLYLADWPQLLMAVQKAPVKISPLLLVGHNPGLEQLALALALKPQSVAERGRAQKLAQKFPTAALAVFDFEIKNWKEVKPGFGRLVDFVRPKDVIHETGETEE